MASPPLNFPYHFPPPQPHFQPPPPPPPPPHHFPPPPPHVTPPPPPSSPSSHTTVIVIVFVSCGGLFFLAFLAVALCCFVKKRKKKNIQETEIVDVDEHLKVKEAIVEGPHGPQTVVLSVEDDVHVHETIRKKEKDSHFKSICFLAAKKKSGMETEVVKVDEHLKVKEEAVLGPRGQEAVVISVEDDLHIEEEMRKSVDKFGHKHPSSSSSDEHKA